MRYARKPDCRHGAIVQLAAIPAWHRARQSCKKSFRQVYLRCQSTSSFPRFSFRALWFFRCHRFLQSTIFGRFSPMAIYSRNFQLPLSHSWMFCISRQPGSLRTSVSEPIMRSIKDKIVKPSPTAWESRRSTRKGTTLPSIEPVTHTSFLWMSIPFPTFSPLCLTYVTYSGSRGSQPRTNQHLWACAY